jgi:alpha-galactosidase
MKVPGSQRKICFIGGGSTQWTPKLFRDIVCCDEVQGGEFLLHDLLPEKSEELKGVCEVVQQKLGKHMRITVDHDLDSALKGSDVVILCISTGGLDAMEVDVELPKKYGIFQPVGDSTGPGGINRTLRNVPVVVDIAKRMEAVCPDAWLLNVSNPMDQIVQAVAETTSIRVLGSCHEYMSRAWELAATFGVENWLEGIRCKVAGLNHFAWILDFKVEGADGYPLLDDYLAHPDAYYQNRLKAQELRDKDTTLNPAQMAQQNLRAPTYLLYEQFGYLPYPNPRHVVEFFPHFLTEKTDYAKQMGVNLTSVEDRRTTWLEGQKKAIDAWMDPDTNIIPDRGIDHPMTIEALSRMISALFGGNETTEALVMPNTGQIANLPHGPCVETMVRITANDAIPESTGDLPPTLLALVLPHAISQDLTVKGAIEGNRTTILQAMQIDPLCRNIGDFRLMETLLDDMMAGTRQWLPQFQ